MNYDDMYTSMVDSFALHELICDTAGKPMDYRFLVVNPAFEKMTGLCALDIIGKTVLQVLPNTESYWIEQYGRVAKTGQTLHFENYSQDIGSHFRVTAYCPKPNQFATIFTDITELKQAQDSLQHSRAMFHSSFHHAGIGMVIVGLDGRLLELNDAYCSITGRSREELLLLKFQDISWPEDLPKQMERIAALLAGTVDNYQVEKRYQTPDRGKVWVWVSFSLVRDSRGAAEFFIAQVLDIDARKQMEAELLNREMLFDSVLGSTADGIFGLDTQGRCIFSNSACMEMLGYQQAAQLIGKDMSELIGHRADGGRSSAPEHNSIGQALLGRKQVHLDDVLVQRADGHSFSADLNSSPLIRDGEEHGAVVSLRDITEKKQIRMRIEASAQLAALGEMAAGVAHEINNPVNGIINYAQLLINRGKLDADGLTVARRILKEGDRIAQITHSLLSITRQGEDAKTSVSMKEIINEVMVVLRAKLLSDGITLQVSIPEGIPEIVCVKHQIEQIVLNLIRNSRHALNERYPEYHKDKLLRISANLQTVNGENFLCIDFLDHGVGVRKELLERILNPFFTTKPSGVGSGLGLSVSYEIIKGHGGELAIASVHGEYTRVSVSLPVLA